MIRVLFICHGNICRSPMAEFVLKDMLTKMPGMDSMDFYVESAATSREEIGNDIYPPAKRCMEKHGIPYSHRAARQMTQADYGRFDHIIVMDENNIRNLKRIIGSDDAGKVSKLLDWVGIDRDVADPWYTGDFEKTFDDIVVGCKALIGELL